MAKNNSNKENNAQFFQPTFINEAIQSLSCGEEIRYETLVYPAMFAHNTLTNVAIIGGREFSGIQRVC